MKKFFNIIIKSVISQALLIIFINFIIFIPNAIYAADSTPSASIQQKLEDLKQEIASKASLIKQTISQKLQNKVYIGKITAKTTRSLELETKSGIKSVVTNEDTAISKTLLKIGDKVATLGDIDDTGALHAKKVVLLPKSEIRNPKSVLWGRIISEEDKLIILETKDKKKVPVSPIKINVQYKIGDFVIITGYRKEDGIIEALFFHNI